MIIYFLSENFYSTSFYPKKVYNIIYSIQKVNMIYFFHFKDNNNCPFYEMNTYFVHCEIMKMHMYTKWTTSYEMDLFLNYDIVLLDGDLWSNLYTRL